MSPSKYRILLVEDDRIDQMAFCRYVQAQYLPYAYCIVESVSEARDVLEKQRFDAVIADYRLGDGTGFDILRLVGQTPLVFATGAGSEDVAVAAMKAGAGDYLIKDPAHNYLKVLPGAVEKVIRLARAERAQKQYEMLKNELIMTVAHELRTPLCIFRGIVTNALDNVFGRLRPKLRSQLQVAKETVDRLSGIVADFIDLSLIDAGALQLEKSHFCLPAMVDEVVASLESENDAQGNNIEMRADEADMSVLADRRRIAQVLQHLIRNAIRFTKKGHIVIAIDRTERGIRIAISDTGPGIEPDALESIFDRFVQLRRAAGPGAHGTGLGLAVAKALIELHGGSLEAESRWGQGSVFRTTLPASAEGELSGTVCTVQREDLAGEGAMETGR